jgi:hypothetical protein
MDPSQRLASLKSCLRTWNHLNSTKDLIVSLSESVVVSLTKSSYSSPRGSD